MILTCPSCATRYQADEAKFPPAGRQVRCAKCGHAWHQPAPEPEVAPLCPCPNRAAPIEAPAPAPARGNPHPLPNRACAAPPATPPAAAKPRQPLLPMLGVALGWIGLIAVVLLIGLSAVRYRQEITVIWPQSAGVYSAPGHECEHPWRSISPMSIITAKAKTARWCWPSPAPSSTMAARELPVPQNVRVTLSDAGNHELYHWNFHAGRADPEARPDPFPSPPGFPARPPAPAIWKCVSPRH